MRAFSTATRPFLTRRWPIPTAVAAAVLLGSAAWYLGAPLFIRTAADEALRGVTATLASGQLSVVDSVHRGQGPVSIVEASGTRYLRFEGVAIANGPDLHVYLSPDTGGRFVAESALYVGALKATDGSFHYELPQAMDVTAYRSVVVWCRAFGVLFTWADLSR